MKLSKIYSSQAFVISILAVTAVCLLCSLSVPRKNQRRKVLAISRVVKPRPDTSSLIRNPLNGWVIYAAGGTKPDFWKKFDSIYVPVLNKKVAAASYANVLYIRVGWAVFEPTEGDYAWRKPGLLRTLLEGAQARGLKIAFRFNVDSRDKLEQCTPDYVRLAGAQGFMSKTGRHTWWSPYPDDPIFQSRYERFIQALAEDFNNPDQVDFVDGYGLGKWGEAHSVNYIDVANRAKVFDWITDLYVKYFTKVPLVINYHRLIGTPREWGAPDPQSLSLLESAFRKGYALRHDAFGMTDYYQKFEKQIPAKWFPERPVICEGGWLHNGNNNGFLKDSRGFKNWGEVWQGEYDDAAEAHANMLDLRGLADATSWFETSYPLIQKFIKEGGYRLYPDSVSLPVQIKAGTTVSIVHRWRNLGMGVCPTNLPQYHNKYKVAFALLKNGLPVPGAVWTDQNADPSKWLKGAPVSHQFKMNTRGLSAGSYQWAVAIVDATKNNAPGISLAVAGNTASGKWVPLSTVNVKSR